MNSTTATASAHGWAVAKRVVIILAAYAVVALAIAGSASAADTQLAALGKTSNTASLQFTNCRTLECKAQAGTGFLRADTQFMQRIVTRFNAGSIRMGTVCFGEAKRITTTKNAQPWLLVKGWIAHRVTDSQLAWAQVRFLQQAAVVARVC